ncbi:MAG TPA: 3-isopropylmalate dehydratase small subunit [Candidatus Sulfotelmatobacter sp.]|nr:3-isopropylmalate dehydratase small subunit [Candidatus Sulfotelmatobacter sp.]
MRPFRVERGVLVPLPRSNVDTDQIVPKQFLKRIERSGYGDFLFFDWRFSPDGQERDDFVLNQRPYRQGRFLVAGRNFGCGSSREHAVWALADHGFRAVIAPSFADIFRSNSVKVGLLPVILPEEAIDSLIAIATAQPGAEATVDLERQTVSAGNFEHSFEMDAFERHCLLDGLDDIALTLQQEPAIAAFEAKRPRWMPDLRRQAVAS